MRRCNKLCLLSWQQRRVLLYAYLWLNALRLALWFFPFGTIRRQIENIKSIWICGRTTNPISIELVAWSVAVSSRYAPGTAKCLVQALTTQLLLNRYRYPHKLHIGVAMGESRTLEAHAWVECQGKVIIGGLSNLGKFRPLSKIGIGV